MGARTHALLPYLKLTPVAATCLQKSRDPAFAQLLEESERALETKKGSAAAAKARKAGARGRKSEKQEDAELLAADASKTGDGEGEDEAFVFTESPACASASKAIWATTASSTADARFYCSRQGWYDARLPDPGPQLDDQPLPQWYKRHSR